MELQHIAKLLENQNTLFGEMMRQMSQQSAAAAAAPTVSPNVPLPPPLSIDGDMEENMSFFESNWKNYATAIGMNDWSVVDEPKKVSFLLSVVGAPALKKYFNFELTAQDKQNSDTVLAAIRAKVVCKRNLIVDRLEFFSAAQLSSESVDEFVCRLKSLAKPCKFGALEPELITYKLVTSNKWPHVKTKMLTMNDVDTAKAIDLCRMEEITAKHSQVLSLDRKLDVNKVKTSKSRKCKFCGEWHVFAKGSCPAYGKKCKKCSGKNHFEKVCRVGKESFSKHGKSRKVKEVKDEEYSTDGSDSEHDYGEQSSDSEVEGEIGKIYDNSQKGGSVLAEVMMKADGKWKNVKCELDTGANTSLVGYDWLCKLTNDPDPVLLPSPFKLQAFGGNAITVLGQVKFPCKHKNKKYILVLQVVDVSHRPLLSLRVCTTLGLVKFCKNVSVSSPLSSNNDMEMLKIYRIRAEEIVDQFSDIFNGYGKMEGEVTLEVDTTVPPVIQQPRRVPIALRDKLQAELDKLQQDGIITREYNHTEWVSNILLVRRGSEGSNALRICLDPIPLNKALKRPNLQFVTLDEILPELGQAKVFSTVDAKKGFWHVVLDENSSKLTSFWTPFGRYRWLRLPFGITSAPEIFQTKLQEIIHGLKGVECLADDLLIYGRGETFEEALVDHNRNLEKLLLRLQQHNVKLNKAKLKLCETSVKFYGHILTTQGLKPDESKVSSIVHYPTPSNRAELHRFVGMITYLSRFIPNLSANCVSLRQLISEKVPWEWTSLQNEEFLKLKSLVADIKTLRYYDVRQPLVIECDASSFGLGAAVFQQGGIIGFASRTLTATEKNYAQIEKELLSILFACTRFDQLVVGNPKTIIKTDHKPLINIFKKPLLTAPKRLQHMLLNLQRYDIEIQFVTGKENVVADAISRAPHNDTLETQSFKKMNIYRVFKQLEDWKLSSYLSISDACLATIIEATLQDSALQAVRHFIQNGWPNSIKIVPASAKMYYKYRDELSTQDGLIFRNDRIVIPSSLQRSMIDRVHASHNGIESTLRLARENVFWPGMSPQITDVVKECSVCARYGSSQPKPPMQSHPVPIYPFQVVSLDIFFAEYRGRKRNFLVMVDHYSDYIELDILKDMTASTLVEICKRNFARYGVPQLVISDNGTNLVNEEMKNFAKLWNFEHSTSAPSHQQANGKAEAAVKIMKRLIQKSEDTGENLWYAVLNWRNTPNRIGSSPACRLFSRSTRCGVPASVEKYLPRAFPNVSENILENRRKIKYYYDRKARDLPTFEPGSPVYVQLHPESDKKWTPAVIQHKDNERSYMVEARGSCYRRDLVNIKPRKEPVSCPPVPQPLVGQSSHQENQAAAEPSKPPICTPPRPRLSTDVIPLSPTRDHLWDNMSNADQPQQSVLPSVLPTTETKVLADTAKDAAKASRPKRERKMPAKFQDYVLKK